MIVIRQSALRTSIAMGVLVVAFGAMGAYGYLKFDPGRGRMVATVLLVLAVFMALATLRGIFRGTIVAVLRKEGLELRSGHFAQWGLIDWQDITDVFLLRTVGLRLISLQLTDRQRYINRMSLMGRWSLELDRHLASGADAYVSASAVRCDPENLARLIRLFVHSPKTREHFGGDEMVLEFPSDVTLNQIAVPSNGAEET